MEAEKKVGRLPLQVSRPGMERLSGRELEG